MKKIDLSKLTHKQLPTKDININICGEEQVITIKPINGRGLTSVGLISDEDVDKTSKMCLLSLIYGLGITQEQAELFMNADTVAADSIAAAVLALTGEYQAELAQANKEIKKNSRTKTQK